jgi:uncharacterized short protein YbdD (DUF466 family)
MGSAESNRDRLAAWARVRARAAGAGRLLRRLVGAPDYDTYVQHVRAHHPGTTPMDRQEFMTRRLDDRYSKPGARCC